MVKRGIFGHGEIESLVEESTILDSTLHAVNLSNASIENSTLCIVELRNIDIETVSVRGDFQEVFSKKQREMYIAGRWFLTESCESELNPHFVEKQIQLISLLLLHIRIDPARGDQDCSAL